MKDDYFLYGNIITMYIWLGLGERENVMHASVFHAESI